MGTGCRPAAVLARPENTYPAAEPGKPTQPCCWAGRATLLLSRGRRNRPSRLPPLAGRSPRSLSRAPGSVRPRGQGAAIVRRSCRPIAAFALAGTRVAPGEPGPAGSPPATVAEAALPRGRGAGSSAMTLSRGCLSSESGQATDGAPKQTQTDSDPGLPLTAIVRSKGTAGSVDETRTRRRRSAPSPLLWPFHGRTRPAPTAV